MTQLERDLRALGTLVGPTADPDLAARVQSRIAGRRSPRFRLTIVLATASVLLALAVAFAVPPARGAILRFFGFGAVQIEFVDRIPAAPVRNRLDLGTRTTLAGARSTVSYRVLTSSLLGAPDNVYVRGEQVGFVYRGAGGVRVIVTQVPGSEQPAIAKKLAGPGTHVVETRVGGAPGVWIAGSPHAFFYLDAEGRVVTGTLYLAGNTLLWQRGMLTVRLEGRLTLAEARRIAGSFR